MAEKKIIDMDDLMSNGASIDNLVSFPNAVSETNDWKHKSGGAQTAPVGMTEGLDVSSVDLSGLDPEREDYAPRNNDNSSRFVYAEENTAAPQAQSYAEPAPAPSRPYNSGVDDILSKYSGGFEVGTTAPPVPPAPRPVPEPFAPTTPPDLSGAAASGIDFDLPPIRRVTIPETLSEAIEANRAADSGLPPLPQASVTSADSGLPPLPQAPVTSADSGLPPLPQAPVTSADSGLPPLPHAPVTSADSVYSPLPQTPAQSVDSGLPPLRPVSVPNADSGLPPLRPVSVPNAEAPSQGYAPAAGADKISVTIPGMGGQPGAQTGFGAQAPSAADDDLPPLKPIPKEDEEKTEERYESSQTEESSAEEEDDGFIYEAPNHDDGEALPADMSDVQAPKLDDMMAVPTKKSSFERPENKIEGMDDPFAKNMSAARRKKLEEGFDAPVTMKSPDPSTYREIEENERMERAEKGKKSLGTLPIFFALTGILAIVGDVLIKGNLVLGGISCGLAVIGAVLLAKGPSGVMRILFAVMGIASVLLGFLGIDFFTLIGSLSGAPVMSLAAAATAALHAVCFVIVTLISFVNKNINEYYRSLKEDN